jgi:glycosyltransferase involved in cell wall biosynthesis
MTSVALLVCTYRRPGLFCQFMQSAARLQIPDNVSFKIAISDNNPASERSGYIAAAIASCPFPVIYGHEPRLGYSNARNKSLSLALETDAEVFLMCDDDQVMRPDWVIEHLAALERYNADVIRGSLIPRRCKFTEGQRLDTSMSGNVSFRRRLIDPKDLGMTFDDRFNEHGGEDLDFFRRAGTSGAKMNYSAKPAVFLHDPGSLSLVTHVRHIALNEANVARAARRNKVAALRKSGSIAGVLAEVVTIPLLVARGIISAIGTIVLLPFGTNALRQCISSSMKQSFRAFGIIEGLFREQISRQSVRRNA